MNNIIYKIREHKKSVLVLSVIFGIFFLLLIGNLNYSSKYTGKATQELKLSSEDKQIAESLAQGELVGNINLEENVKTQIKQPVLDNKVLEFDTPEGKIELEFDLLNYSEWYAEEKEGELEAENFDVNINKSKNRYKWGYDVKLKDLNFMAKINVRADNIQVIDNQTLKIGNYYLSFADLKEQNFSVNIEPVVLEEINLTTNLTILNMTNLTETNITEFNITEQNLTNITLPVSNITEIINVTQSELNQTESQALNESVSDTNQTEVQENETETVTPQNETEQVSEETTAETTEENPEPSVEQPIESNENQETLEELPTITSSIIKSFANFIIGGVKGVSGFLVNGIRGITGFVAGEEVQNTISIYVQKDFGNSSYNVGDLINLDPILIGIMGGTATNGTIVYQCGTINESGSYIMNQSITNNTLTTDCITISAQDVSLDCNGSFIKSDDTSGIYSDKVNTTIKNCNVSMSGAYSTGIALIGANNSYIANNILRNNWQGLNLGYLESVTVFNNTFRNNTMYEISSGYISNVIIDNNIFLGRGTGIDGISINNNNITNNIINSIHGIYTQDSDNNLIENNSLKNSTGIALDYSSNYNTLVNNTIWNCTDDDGGCLFIGSSSGNRISGGIINLSSFDLIHIESGALGDSSSNNVFKDIILLNSQSYDISSTIELGGTSVNALNNTFLNVSYNKSKENIILGHEIIRKWYYQVYINDTNGNSVSNADVKLYDKDNFLRTSLTTNSSGWTEIGEVIDYINSGGTRSYYSNYNIYAYNSTSLGNVSYNITSVNNKLDNTITVSNSIPTLVVSNVSSTPSKYSAVISWNTNIPSNSSINYGSLISLGNISSSSEFDLYHFITLNNLSRFTFYYYNVSSCDFTGNCATNGTNNFTTLEEVYLNACSILADSDTVYYLNKSLSSGEAIPVASSSGCFDIQAENVTLDCQENYIISNSNIVGIYSDQDNTKISNCNVSITGISGTAVYLEYSKNSVLSNITTSNNLYSLYFISINNTQVQNIDSSSDSYMFYLDSCYNNSLYNATSVNNGSKGSFGGVDIYRGGFNNITLFNGNRILFEKTSNNQASLLNLSSNTIYGDQVYNVGIYGATNNTIYDSSFNRITLYDDIPSTNPSNTLINCTYNLSKESVQSGSSLYRKWYYRAHTEDIGGTDVENASVKIYNGIDEAPYINLTTNSTGWTNITYIIEYVNTGGTRTIYDTSVIAANFNLTLWDDHLYNVTNKTNNLNDSFILDVDITPPVLSGSVATSTSGWLSATQVAPSSSVIVWNTDDPSNSSVQYGLTTTLEIGSSGDNVMKVSNHSVSLTGLVNDTSYYFNYTSCDFAGNCNTSSGSFSTPSPGDPPLVSSTGGGISCISNWQCSVCSGAPVGQTGTQTCNDLNKCSSIITETQSCIVQESYFKKEKIPTEPGQELPQSTVGKGGAVGCISNWQCSDWNSCQVVYNLEDIIKGRTLLKGEQERLCKDLKNCNYDKIERQECSTKQIIYAEKVEKCFDNFLEIFNEDNVLISRLKLVEGQYEQLNVQMLFDEAGYCPYCYDGQKNYDEDEIDCQYVGVSCPRCSLETPFLRQNYSLMLIVLLALTLLCFLFIIWYLVLWKKTRKRVNRIVRMSKLDFVHLEKAAKNNFKLSNKTKHKILLVLGILIGISIIGFFIFMMFKYSADIDKTYNTIVEGSSGLLSSLSSGISKFILPVLIVLSLFVLILIIRIVYKRRIGFDIFNKSKELMRDLRIDLKRIIKKDKQEINTLKENTSHIIQREIKSLESGGYRAKLRLSRDYNLLIGAYNRNYKKLLKLRKKILKKHEKIIKKEKKTGMPLERKRRAYRRSVEKYKIGIEKLRELKERIKKLESLGYSNTETEELKNQLNRDIEKLRNKK